VDLRHSDHDGTSPFFAAVHGKHAEIVVHLRSVCGVDEERVTENPFRHCSRNHVRRAHKEHAKKLEAQHQRDARCEQAMRQIMGPTRAYAAASARGQRDVRRLPCARPLRSALVSPPPPPPPPPHPLSPHARCCACLPPAAACLPCRAPCVAFFWGEGALVLLTSSAAVARLCARRAPGASCGGRRCASRPAASSRRWTVAWRCRYGAVRCRGEEARWLSWGALLAEVARCCPYLCIRCGGRPGRPRR
jgi:hypothetical protein